MRLAVLLVPLAACPPSDTGLTPDTGDPQPLVYEGVGPQKMVCTHHNCCAIIDGSIVCQGEADNYGLWDAPAGDEWAGLESNPRYLCAMNTMGEWTCWGDAATTVPIPAPGLLVSDIRFGEVGGIALRPDGSIMLWGDDTFGQISDAPQLVGPYIAVEAGYGWRCAADELGVLTCWGISVVEGVTWIEHAQVDDAPIGRGFRGLNRGVGDVLSGIDTEGRVYSWGGGYEFVTPLNDVFADNVAPSDNYLCARLPGGALACQGELPEPPEPVPCSASAQPTVAVSDVACGLQWCAAVVEGAIECWAAVSPMHHSKDGAPLTILMDWS